MGLSEPGGNSEDGKLVATITAAILGTPASSPTRPCVWRTTPAWYKRLLSELRTDPAPLTALPGVPEPQNGLERGWRGFLPLR